LKKRNRKEEKTFLAISAMFSSIYCDHVL